LNDSRSAVFLSYAKQDAGAAEQVCAALRAAGVEVWFDQSALRGGDAWDAAIRRQIKNCALMIPVISANTQARAEGYFRLEWKLAIDRSHLMAHDRTFIVPVVIDETQQGDERVPDKFAEVQWTRLPGGATTPEFIARIAKLLGQAAGSDVASTATVAALPASAAPVAEAAAPAPVAATGAAAAPAAVAPPARPRSGRLPLIGVAVLVFAGIVGWAMRGSLFAGQSVVPYSNEDRRMTYALLPFESINDDTRSAQVASAVAGQLRTMLERRHEVVSLVPAASAATAAAKEATTKKIAQQLAVHFLVRGRVAREGAGYKVTVLALDGDSERVLTTESLTVPADALLPRWPDETRDLTYALIRVGLKAEVERARSKPVSALDVRDLAFRAGLDWRENRDADGKAANANANALLDKALALAPNDLYALRQLAIINLCDCVNSWSPDPEVQKAKGAVALEQYLRQDSDSLEMLDEKTTLYQLRGRWEDALVIAETQLAQEPTYAGALGTKAVSYLRLRRLKEAKAIMDGVLVRYPNLWIVVAIAADIDFASGDYANAAQLAQKAIAQMSEPDLRDRWSGPIRLTQIAAEAQLGHADRTKAALEDFHALMPGLKTMTAVRQWVHPSADLADFEPLYAGLAKAGIKD
jgi:TolB-like protein/tetratricopeptide (TPR) repeat protein